MQKDLQRIRQKCLLETLTLMDAGEYAEYMGRIFENSNVSITGDGFTAEHKGRYIYAFHNHPSSECGVTELLRAYRALKDKQKITIVSLSDFSDDAKKLCISLPAEIHLVPGKDVLILANKLGMMPDEETAKEKAEKEMNETIITFEKLKKSAFGRTKVKGYIICGIVVMCWPFVSGFRFYYPLIAIICFAMAILTYRKNRQAKESSDIGIS
ncbi:MAG: hypothetical protein PHO15_05170 [Eubacteriales bacterium]|nr:hypothetical protein [Eubacteriales bacterium]